MGVSSSTIYRYDILTLLTPVRAFGPSLVNGISAFALLLELVPFVFFPPIWALLEFQRSTTAKVAFLLPVCLFEVFIVIFGLFGVVVCAFVRLIFVRRVDL